MRIIQRLPLLFIFGPALCYHVERDESSSEHPFFVFFKMIDLEFKMNVLEKSAGVLITGSTALTTCQTVVRDDGTYRETSTITAVVNHFDRIWWYGYDLQYAHSTKIHPNCTIYPETANKPPVNNTAIVSFRRDFLFVTSLPKFASVIVWMALMDGYSRPNCYVAVDGGVEDSRYNHRVVRAHSVVLGHPDHCAKLFLSPSFDSEEWFETSGTSCAESASLPKDPFGLGSPYYCIIGNTFYIVGINADFKFQLGAIRPKPTHLYSDPKSFSYFISAASELGRSTTWIAASLAHRFIVKF